MCRIEGICLECANTQNCPMLEAHRDFDGTLRSVMCIEFKPISRIIEERVSATASAA